MNSASLCSLAGRYDNPIPTRCLAPIDLLKIPAQGKRDRRGIEGREEEWKRVKRNGRREAEWKRLKWNGRGGSGIEVRGVVRKIVKWNGKKGS